jgi:hypothetical protein
LLVDENTSLFVDPFAGKSTNNIVKNLTKKDRVDNGFQWAGIEVNQTILDEGGLV